ncbi:hypothetical protein ABW636_02800 [Aquimarina sp. 2201CG1-2-11]|uniref:hypothetical protein n=1 Tax=Aquimarina discodermiae TaxID=3231043 RepID=UPI0034634C91
MGYELNIIRETDSPIQLQEWIKYINNDSELEAIDISEEKKSIEGTNMQLPLGNAALFKNQNTVFTFSIDYNMISVTNPNQETIDKMIQIANTLGAIVQGEEGELYNSLSNPKKYEQFEFVGIKKPKKWFEFWRN